SLMIPFIIGQDEATIQKRLEAHRAMFSDLPPTRADWEAAGFLGSSPQQLLDQLKALEEAGIERFMLQHNDLDDWTRWSYWPARCYPTLVNFPRGFFRPVVSLCCTSRLTRA